MRSLRRDLRNGWRRAWRRPWISLAMILAFALGAGANLGILAVCFPVLLDAVPFDRSDRLAALLARNDSRGIAEGLMSLSEIDTWRQQSDSLEEIVAYAPRAAILASEKGAERVRAPWVSANFFPLFGITPVMGRVLAPGDETPGSHRVAVLSHAFWKGRLGGNSAVVGQTIHLDGMPFVVVGVAAEGPVFPKETDLWVPAARLPFRMNPGLRLFRAVARLEPGVSIQEVREEARIIEQIFARDHPDASEGWTVDLKLLEDYVVERVRAPLTLLAAAGVVVFLIALVNVFNLLLTEASGRSQRTTMTLVLGARRWDLLREQVVYVILLAGMGGVLSVLLAVVISRLLLTTDALSFPNLQEVVTLPWIVLGTLFSVMGAGLALGVMTALLRSPIDFTAWQRGEGPATSSGVTAGRGRRSLIAAQVALSFLLLVGAGLLINSFLKLIGQDLGFSPRQALTAELSLPPAEYPDDETWRRGFGAILEKAATLPGATSVGLVTGFPLGGRFMVGNAADADAANLGASERAIETDVRLASEGYFGTLKIPILEGRGFQRSDTAGGVAVAIVNRTLSNRLWPDGDAVGRWLTLSSHPDTRFEIIGVVADVRQIDLAQEPSPEAYLTFRQFPGPWMQLVVRSSGPTVLGESLRTVIQEVDKDILVEESLTLPEALRESLSTREFLSSTLGGFAIIASVLAIFGVFSVGMFIVSRQYRSYGIRLALGANKNHIFRLVFRQEFVWVAYGLIAGVLCALGGSRLLSNQLFGVSPVDPITFVGAGVLLALAAASACVLPAYRASRVPPVVSLRES